MKIDIVSDVTCPWCYIGKRNLEAAMAQRPDLSFEVQWLPYQLHPKAPTEGYNYQGTLTKKYGRERIAMLLQQLSQAGKMAGIDLQLDRIEQGANTFQAHRLLEFAKDKGLQNEVSEALFSAYFCEGRFIGDLTVLIDIAAEQGIDRQETSAYLDSDQGIKTIQKQLQQARDNEISGVPNFTLNNKFVIPGGQSVETFLHTINRVHEKS